MENTDTKQKFIELRAKGNSYDKIAEELSVSKQTLINWSKELDIQIANYKAIEMEALYEQHYVSKQKRVEMLGNKLEKMNEELEKRDYADIPTEKLLDMIMKYSTVLKNEYSTIIFKEKVGMLAWDHENIVDWVG